MKLCTNPKARGENKKIFTEYYYYNMGVTMGFSDSLIETIDYRSSMKTVCV